MYVYVNDVMVCGLLQFSPSVDRSTVYEDTAAPPFVAEAVIVTVTLSPERFVEIVAGAEGTPALNVEGLHAPFPHVLLWLETPRVRK